MAQVVQAQVVGGGHPAHVRPGVLRVHVPGGGGEDQGDLSFEPEQFGARGAHHLTGPGQRRGRLQEVGRVLRGPPTLGGAGAVVQVHRDHLAGPVPEQFADRVRCRRRRCGRPGAGAGARVLGGEAGRRVRGHRAGSGAGWRRWAAKKSASAPVSVSGSTCATYWSGRTTTTAPPGSICRSVKMLSVPPTEKTLL